MDRITIIEKPRPRIRTPITLSTDYPVWHRQRGESQKQYKLFLRYLNEDYEPISDAERKAKSQFRWDERRNEYAEHQNLLAVKRAERREIARQQECSVLSSLVSEMANQLSRVPLTEEMVYADPETGEITIRLESKNLEVARVLTILLRLCQELQEGSVIDARKRAYGEVPVAEVPDLRGIAIAGDFRLWPPEIDDELEAEAKAAYPEQDTKTDAQ